MLTEQEFYQQAETNQLICNYWLDDDRDALHRLVVVNEWATLPNDLSDKFFTLETLSVPNRRYFVPRKLKAWFQLLTNDELRIVDNETVVEYLLVNG